MAAMTAAISTTATSTAALDSSSSSPPRTPPRGGGGFSSPWAQVVKGAGESAADGNVGKKTAWKRNVYSGSGSGSGSGSVSSPSPSMSPPPPPPPPSGGVMGGGSWPALSESTRIKSTTTSTIDSSKFGPQDSVPVSQEPVTSHSQPKSNVTTNLSSNMHSAAPNRQRSMKHNANRQGGYSRGPPPPPPLPTFPVPEIAHKGFTKGDNSRSESSSRDSRPSGGFASHSNPSNDHSSHRISNRRGNGGQNSRGDGRNNYHGGRRDQDHGNHEWSSSHSPLGRGAHGHPHRPRGRGFMGPSVQGAHPFAPPPPVRPYGNTLVYPDPALVYYIPSFPAESFGGMPYFTGPPPPPYLVMSDPLRASIIKQIEYYFSDANLVKDEFLRSKMDEQGWVSITLIASFPRVQSLTNSVPFILDCLRGSAIVEVQGDKVRRSDDWLKWIPHQQSPSNSDVQSSVDYDKLTSSIQTMSLENQGNTSSALMEELANNLRVPNSIEASVQRVC